MIVKSIINNLTGVPDAKISPQGSGIHFMDNTGLITDFFGPVISTYTTKEAVADGYLVELTKESSHLKESGIKFPVFFTRTAWDKYVEVPKGMEGEQDLSGRLFDIFTMFRHYIKFLPKDTSFLDFKFICRLPDIGDWLPNEKRKGINLERLVTLHAEIRARDFDDPSPAIFMMIPGED